MWRNIVWRNIGSNFRWCNFTGSTQLYYWSPDRADCQANVLIKIVIFLYQDCFFYSPFEEVVFLIENDAILPVDTVVAVNSMYSHCCLRSSNCSGVVCVQIVVCRVFSPSHQYTPCCSVGMGCYRSRLSWIQVVVVVSPLCHTVLRHK